MANIYLQIEYATGNLFQYAATKVDETYESFTNTKGKESFRKYFKKGLYAKLEGISVRDSNFGKEISLYTKLHNGDTVYFNLPLFDTKKNIAEYAESLITVLPSLKIGENYRFYPYNIKEEGDAYSKVGISVVLADIGMEKVIEGSEKLARLSYSYNKKDGTTVTGDIPAEIWETDYTGAKTKNRTARNTFLYNTLMNIVDSAKSAPAPAQKETPATVAAQPSKAVPTMTAAEAFPSNTEVEPDDLPF